MSRIVHTDPPGHGKPTVEVELEAIWRAIEALAAGQVLPEDVVTIRDRAKATRNTRPRIERSVPAKPK